MTPQFKSKLFKALQTATVWVCGAIILGIVTVQCTQSIVNGIFAEQDAREQQRLARVK